MRFAEDLSQAVGNTPLIKLRRVSERFRMPVPTDIISPSFAPTPPLF